MRFKKKMLYVANNMPRFNPYKPKNLFYGTNAKSADPDQTPRYAASNQVLPNIINFEKVISAYCFKLVCPSFRPLQI